jgi:hypothetical protein
MEIMRGQLQLHLLVYVIDEKYVLTVDDMGWHLEEVAAHTSHQPIK